MEIMHAMLIVLIIHPLNIRTENVITTAFIMIAGKAHIHLENLSGVMEILV